jgi:NAD(P)-dependent dehydrogenase (short-subunit alcohol dehydrogenase family)
MGLEGHTALVTGAARGIGRTISLELAKRGAAVAVGDIRDEIEGTAAAIREQGGRAAALSFDVADHATVRSAVEKLSAELGPIDIVVSNAGLVANIAAFDRIDPEAWTRELAVNLGGAFNVIQATIGTMVERGWGRIVVMSSGAAQGGLHRQAPYAASKAGLLGLIKTITIEYARYGVSCNAVLPGLIETENVRRMPVEIQDVTKQRTPARRLGKMEEVAHLVAFLASEEAGFINGAEINIDGGLRLGTASLGSRREATGQAG